MPPNVAVILSGSGVYDGTEITEAVAVITQLSRRGCGFQMFAPDVDQMHTGDITEEKRNVLIESARIARGKVQPLLALRCDDFDALIIPGGFGAAKNLSNFATTLGAGEGGPDDFTLEPSVASAIKSFHTSKKIIGSCCIAPVLLAKTISGISVTMGCSSGDKFPHGGATGAIEVLNCKHVETTAPCAQAHVDLDNLIVTSAAYMFDGEPHEVLDSVCSMVDKVVELLG